MTGNDDVIFSLPIWARTALEESIKSRFAAWLSKQDQIWKHFAERVSATCGEELALEFWFHFSSHRSVQKICFSNQVIKLKALDFLDRVERLIEGSTGGERVVLQETIDFIMQVIAESLAIATIFSEMHCPPTFDPLEGGAA